MAVFLGSSVLITTQIGWCDIWNTLIILDVTKFEPYRHCFTQVFYTNNKKHTVAEHSIKLLLEIMHCICNLQIKVSKQLTS